MGCGTLNLEYVQTCTHLVDGRQRDVVVEELPELHEHEGVPAVEVGHVGVDNDGDEARTGQRLALHRAEARTRDRCIKRKKKRRMRKWINF